MGVRTIDLGEMTVEQKLMLLEEIWEDLSQSAENLPISDEVKAELDRREEAARLNPEAVESWEVVRERLRSGQT